MLQNEIGKYNSALKLFCTRVYKCTLSKEVPFRLPRCIFYTITSYFTSENFSLRYSDVYDAYAFSQKLKIIIYFFSLFAIVHLTWFFALQLCAEMHIKGVIICRAKKMLLARKKGCYSYTRTYPSQSVDGAEEYHKKSYGHLTTVFYFKVIHPKYYKHLKKGAHQSHLGRQKMGWFLAD